MVQQTFDINELKSKLKKKAKDITKDLQKDFKKFPYGFWEFQKYMSPAYYTEERKDSKLVAVVLYLLSWGYISKCALSMPRRRGKSRSVNDLVKYDVGYKPTRSNARFSYSETLVKKHSRFIRTEIQSEKYRRIFPEVKLDPTNKSVTQWSVTKCSGEPTFSCAGVGGAATGNGVNNLLIGDDMIKGMTEALSPVVMSTLNDFRDGNYKSSEEPGMKQLEVATRWTDDDPIGDELKKARRDGNRVITFNGFETKLTDKTIQDFINEIINAKLTEYDWVEITIPALDKYEKSTAEEIQPTEKLIKKRDSLINGGKAHVWYSIYQQDPRPKGAMLFKDFNNFYLLSDLGDFNFTGGIMCIDPAFKGSNNLCAVLFRPFGNKLFATDIVYSPDEPGVTKKLLLEFMRRNKNRVSMIFAECNGGGEEYIDNLQEKIDDDPDLNFQIEHVYTDQNKEVKIFISSDWIKEKVSVPAKENEFGERQYAIDSDWDRAINSLTKYVGKLEGKFVKNQEDDFLDTCCIAKTVLDEDANEVEVVRL